MVTLLEKARTTVRKDRLTVVLALTERAEKSASVLVAVRLLCQAFRELVQAIWERDRL